jgi:hypothetical protein
MFELILIFIGACSWGLTSVLAFQHGLQVKPESFFGVDSWKRKYKTWNGQLVRSRRTFYYKTFNLKYKERFPLSATLLVFLSDGYHACQFVAIQSLLSVIALQSDYKFVPAIIVLNIVFKVGFGLVYYRMNKL